jgi:aspartyl-tRNA(Asn)/glutamyl-tRNA(Gln) amidotransferase subunit B
MRSKEEAADYRYFPDPDLPPLVIAPERIDAIRMTMPELPGAREERFMKAFGFERAVAHELTAEAGIADYFEALVKEGVKPRLASNWTREEAMRLANETHKPLVEAAPIMVMAKLVKLVDEGKVARVVAKMECGELFANPGTDPESYFKAKGMIQVQDAGQLTGWVAQAIAQEPKVVEDIKGGKLAAVGRLVGVTMKLSGGKAEPNAVKAELLKQLGVTA